MTFRRLLQDKVATYLRKMPADPDHAFLRMAHAGTSLTLGRIWGLVVRDAKGAARHHHGDAYLSAIYYVDVPDEMYGPDGSRAGWLEIGRPDIDIGFRDEDVMYVEPIVGKLIVMPAYIFHAVLPTSNPRARVSIACDIMLSPAP